MKIVFLLFYLLYKTGIVLLLFGGLQHFSLRVEMGLWVVYGFFSLGGIFLLFQGVVAKKVARFSRWTIWWLVVFEWLATGMVGFYLYVFRESSVVRVLWVIASLAPLHLLFFDLMRLWVSRWNKEYLANLQKPSWVFEYGLEIPFLGSVGFLGWEGIQKGSKGLLFWCVGLVGWVILRHYLGGWVWQKAVKKLSRWLMSQNPLVFHKLPPIHDTNMLSPLLFAWQQYVSRIKSLQKQLLWLHPGLSEEIQEKLVSDSEIRFGIERPATVVALFWQVGDLTPLQEYAFLETLAKTTMEYVHQYDGFPFWEHHRMFVFFGFPYFYEYKNLAAIEFSQRVLSEITAIAHEQDIKVEGSILILAEKVRIGAVPVFGEEWSQLIPEGKIFQRLELVRRASEGLKIPLLIDKRALEGLENRFFIQKTYKITIFDEMLILCQVGD
ncbi:MAG: hypothetical protein N2314_04145 [Brevinematales bacterium]|nr:hypothetical protein [Brevinematales bacterium]